jgi:hypothetical protein
MSTIAGRGGFPTSAPRLRRLWDRQPPYDPGNTEHEAMVVRELARLHADRATV